MIEAIGEFLSDLWHWLYTPPAAIEVSGAEYFRTGDIISIQDGYYLLVKDGSKELWIIPTRLRRPLHSFMIWLRS